jgi:hypothetical protein
MKIRPVGATLFHADGRTDMTKLRVTFRNFAKASKIVNSRIKLAATVVQVPSTVAHLFKCTAPRGPSAQHGAKYTCVQKCAYCVSAALIKLCVTRDEPTDDTGHECPTCDLPVSVT